MNLVGKHMYGGIFGELCQVIQIYFKSKKKFLQGMENFLMPWKIVVVFNCSNCIRLFWLVLNFTYNPFWKFLGAQNF